MMVYTVQAFRWGNRERHSYIVGVFSTKESATAAAEAEEEYRGGKYSCQVCKFPLLNAFDPDAISTLCDGRIVREMIPHPSFTE